MLILNYFVSLFELKVYLSFFDWYLFVVCGWFCCKFFIVLFLFEINVLIEKKNYNWKCVDIFKKWLIKLESEN